MLVLHWASDKGGLWRFLLVGLTFGLVVQVRSTPITFPAWLLLYTHTGYRAFHREALEPVNLSMNSDNLIFDQ